MNTRVYQHAWTRTQLLSVARAAVLLFALSPAPVTAGGLLWRVLGGHAPAHLLGSMHYGVAQMYPMHPLIEQAIAEAERVMVEVDLLKIPPSALAAEIVSRGTQPAGQSLQTQLPDDLWRDLVALAGRLSVPVATVQRQKPWLSALTLGSIAVLRLGMNERHGVDLHVLNRVRSRTPVAELEGFDAQLELFSGLALSDQLVMLDAAVRGFDRAQALAGRILDAWRLGDSVLLTRVLAEDAALGEPAALRLRAKLLTQRNRRMTQRIAGALQQPGSVLVVVGAAHLVGPDSIVEQLAARGYAVNQLATGAE